MICLELAIVDVMRTCQHQIFRDEETRAKAHWIFVRMFEGN